MNIFRSLIAVIINLLTSLAFLTGCGSSRIGHQYNYIKPNSEVISNTGYLKIHTLKYLEKYFASDAGNEAYKGYSIYNEDGDFIEDISKAYDNPALVRLAEGNYIIVAELHKNIIQSFSVKIESGKVLEIDAGMIQNPIALSGSEL